MRLKRLPRLALCFFLSCVFKIYFLLQLFNWNSHLTWEPVFHFIATLRKYRVPLSAIIPFPKRNDPSNAQDFPPGRPVLAVYPGTTALYRATVVNGNRKVTIRPFTFI